ncbi:hypothetical protein [Stutzerimonas nitrititolerans]|uniref:Uncharacterized protein n=1 Tax=Stutzerimonas nitrititolerans TaxID=2482751 RepID=A0AA41WNI9_9GAMM|nr:hypothetical protein [Stutzerimonas nitrititolerans]MCO7546170.1 hypothetical protein [Stutzerimonas nitrititolerans]
MADIYDRSRALAVRMLAPRSRGGKGLEMALIRTIEGDYDPVTGGTSTTTDQYDGSAFRDIYRQDDIDGTYIKQGDVKLLVSPAQLNGADMPEPGTQDRIQFDGGAYTIVSVKPWNYAGLTVGFEVQART